MSIVEQMAEAIWRMETVRVTKKQRLISWSEEGEQEQERFRAYAQAAWDIVKAEVLVRCESDQVIRNSISNELEMYCNTDWAVDGFVATLTAAMQKMEE